MCPHAGLRLAAGAAQVNSSGYHFVRLYFPNFVYGAGAVTAFNVYIEGAQVLSNFQLNAALGAAETEFFVPVTDGQVDIELEAGISGVPFISGISVSPSPHPETLTLRPTP